MEGNKLYINAGYVTVPAEGTLTDEMIKEGASNFFGNRNTDVFFERRTSINSEGEIENIVYEVISNINHYSAETFANYWLDRKNEGINDGIIYRMDSSDKFALIIFNSNDTDSELAKDIVEKFYEKEYNRNTKDWTEGKVIIYDTAIEKSVYPTFNEEDEDWYFFNINGLANNRYTEKIILCGYSIYPFQLSAFGNNENLFVFESNPVKINDVRALVSTKYNGKLSLNKTESKAFQIYKFLKDPIDGFEDSNVAFNILKKLSNLQNLQYESYEDFKDYLKFEQNYNNYVYGDDTTEGKGNGPLVDALFGGIVPTDLENILNTDGDIDESEASVIFENAIKQLNWLNNVAVYNTDEEPTLSQIEKLIKEDNKSYILTFIKTNDNFWTVKGYKCDKELPAAITMKNTLNDVTYYTELGIAVSKTTTYVNGKIDYVQWYTVNKSKKTLINQYIKATEGDYVLNVNGTYELYNTETTYNETNYVFNNENVQLFVKKGNDHFDEVYATNDAINHNKFDLNAYFSVKYTCKGSKYVVEAYLNDTQMYQCLKNRTIV